MGSSQRTQSNGLAIGEYVKAWDWNFSLEMNNFVKYLKVGLKFQYRYEYSCFGITTTVVLGDRKPSQEGRIGVTMISE